MFKYCNYIHYDICYNQESKKAISLAKVGKERKFVRRMSKNIPILVDVSKDFNYEDNAKVLHYPFIQVNDNEINGNKINVGRISQKSQIYNKSVVDNDFENNLTEIMELKASDIYNQTVYHILKPYSDELANFMDGCYTNKELNGMKMFSMIRLHTLRT